MVDYSGYKYLKIEKKDKVATVILKSNISSPGSHQEMEDIWVDLDRDDEVNAVVFTGTGKGFYYGPSFEWRKKFVEDISRFPMSMAHHGRIYSNLLSLEKPVIAAINGDCNGTGGNMALCCDIVIAAEDVLIADFHVESGLVAGDGACIIWPLLIGPNRAKEYLMTGDRITATEAARIGLINKVVPFEELMPTAMALAQRLASGPLQAIAGIKATINTPIKERASQIMALGIAREFLTIRSEDAKEGANALLEKRKPVFKGR